MTATRCSRCSISLSLRATDANRQIKLIKKGRVCRWLSACQPRRRRRRTGCRRNCWAMADNASHPLHETLHELKSRLSSRLTQPRCPEERHRKPIHLQGRASLLTQIHFSKPTCFEMSDLPANTFSILRKTSACRDEGNDPSLPVKRWVVGRHWFRGKIKFYFMS